MNETQPKPSKIIKAEGPKPCGCYVVEYADNTVSITPCPPCGLFAAAESLGRAGQALGAVANRLRAEAGQAAVAAAAQAIKET